MRKKAGFADGDLVEQSHEFSLPRGLDGEALKVFPQAFDVALFHAAAAAILQQAKFVVRMKDARHLINQVSNAKELRVRRSFHEGNELHGRGCHSQALGADASFPQARLADAATNPAGSSTSLTRPSPLMVAPARLGQ